MVIKSITENRKELAHEIAERTGNKAVYMKAPTYAYQIGPYTVLRDGSLEVDDTSADSELISALAAAGYIEAPEPPIDSIEVSVPLEGHDANSLINLVNLIYSKSELINKSTGAAFSIGDSVLSQLDECQPVTKEDFLWVWETAKANADGIIIADDKITFEFPLASDTERTRAYIEFAALMNKQALAQKKVRAEKKETPNEKYAFRVWLVRIGMKGDKYKNVRKILLEKLSGNSSFLTDEQAAAHREKYKNTKEDK